jgi:3',5'-cyclic-AMP phosphodiesterase
MTARLLLGSLTALAIGGCLRFSPFLIELDESERDQTRKNLQQLARQPVPSGARTIGFITDSHDGFEELRDIVDAINDRGGVEFVVHGGDFTDFGTQQEYVWTLDLLKELDMPFFVTAGNHDLLANGREVFRQMFGPDQYSFVHGGIRFVFFNTNTIELGTRNLDLAWLEQELSVPFVMPSVIVTHHTITSRPHILPEETEELRRIQAERGVFLNLHGHFHDGTQVFLDGTTTQFKGAAALNGNYYFITTDGVSSSFEECTLDDGCIPVELMPPPEVTP